MMLSLLILSTLSAKVHAKVESLQSFDTYIAVDPVVLINDVNLIYCFYNSQPQASWSRKNGQASPAIHR